MKEPVRKSETYMQKRARFEEDAPHSLTQCGVVLIREKQLLTKRAENHLSLSLSFSFSLFFSLLSSEAALALFFVSGGRVRVRSSVQTSAKNNAEIDKEENQQKGRNIILHQTAFPLDGQSRLMSISESSCSTFTNKQRSSHKTSAFRLSLEKTHLQGRYTERMGSFCVNTFSTEVGVFPTGCWNYAKDL
jgi:hypothetical protein